MAQSDTRSTMMSYRRFFDCCPVIFLNQRRTHQRLKDISCSLRACVLVCTYTWPQEKHPKTCGVGSKRRYGAFGRSPWDLYLYGKAPVFEHTASSANRARGTPAMRCMAASGIADFRSMCLTNWPRIWKRPSETVAIFRSL